MIGDQLTEEQKERYITEIPVRFSSSFWSPGCQAPKVKGVKLHIEKKEGAVPKVQQPFPLSAYDRLRLEYHEDVEIAEGKAAWLPPETQVQWASPSFVVGQEGKGLLGRPVRDYRWVNSQTKDSAWPSARADETLRRTQRGSCHTKLDCVWGYTQC